MPRKRLADAEREDVVSRQIRFRYLLRNDKFRRDIQRLRSAPNSRLYRRICARWRVHDVMPLISLRVPELTGETIALFDASPRKIHYPPVSARFERPGVLGIYVALDEAPLDSLLPLVESQLRAGHHAHMAKIGRTSKKQTRRRIDRATFYLNVFDLVRAGLPFTQVAAKLGRRPTTVKTAFGAAMAQIFRGTRVPLSRVPSKSLAAGTFDWDRFDPPSHYRSCTQCSKAKTAEEMCPPLRQYALHDERGRSEPLAKQPTK